jgi:outer membrane biosynthesis protein TonB
MKRNFVYSIFLHILFILILFISIKQYPISKNNEQQLFIGFQHSISDSAIATLNQAKIEEAKQQKKLNKFLIDKNPATQDQDLKNDLINNQDQLKADNSAIPIQKTQDETNKQEIVENKKSPTQPPEQDVAKPQIANPNSKTIEESGLSSREKTNILSQLKIISSSQLL